MLLSLLCVAPLLTTAGAESSAAPPDGAAAAAEGDTPTQTFQVASDALEFEKKLDGKCYILSSGGKLVVMHNRDTAQSVKYRLIREFAGSPQMGRTVGTIAPGEGIKLGCSEVDGREQQWVVERASFVQP